MRSSCGDGHPDGGLADETVPCSLLHADTVAVAMICRLVSGEADEDELAAAKEWRDMNPDQAQAFARISHAWTLIKPAGAAWKRKQRGLKLVSALVRLRARLMERFSTSLNRVSRPENALALYFGEHLYPTGDPVRSGDAPGPRPISRLPEQRSVPGHAALTMRQGGVR